MLWNPTDSRASEEEERYPYDNGDASSNVKGAKHNEKKKGKMKQGEVDGDDYDVDKHNENEKKKGKMKQDEVDGDDYDADNIISEKKIEKVWQRVLWLNWLRKETFSSTKQC
ncbi:hypothetical protein Bca101_094274 [Brassica carinata]